MPGRRGQGFGFRFAKKFILELNGRILDFLENLERKAQFKIWICERILDENEQKCTQIEIQQQRK